MASSASTVAYVVEQISDAGDVRARAMFGEYGVYLGEKMIGYVCDDDLFLKATPPGAQFLDDSHLAPPYPGARLAFRVPAELLEDRERLTAFAIATEAALPAPRPKRAKANAAGV